MERFLAGGHSMDTLFITEKDFTVYTFSNLEKYSSLTRVTWILS